MTDTATAHLAIHCLFLKRAIDSGRIDQVATICQHPVRDGTDCVGPFLDDLGTSCGLWEAHPQADLIPLPQPERWQRRRRREGFDYQRAYRDDWH